jgi:uncharacterized phage protein (TIGR01671 family)
MDTQREIKFNVWAKHTKSMISLKEALKQVTFGFLLKFNDTYQLLQYTGLKDKNGEEIFEGDILKQCNGSINGCAWMDKNYVVKHKLKGFDLPFFMWDENGDNNMDSTHWCEVIGNIYENPELLEASK